MLSLLFCMRSTRSFTCHMFQSGDIPAPLHVYQVIRFIRYTLLQVILVGTCWHAGIASDRNGVVGRIVISTFL